jgi:formylmethanofuran dehydrogenase subunit E
MEHWNLKSLLEKSAQDHTHLCPRQVLGVRMGLAGLEVLGFSSPPEDKKLLIISETDGCFVDGLIAATNCTVGHRTLRVEDYGKVAATFIDIERERAVRIAPHPLARQKAREYAPQETRHYFAQLHGYQIMPDEELFVFQDVHLTTTAKELMGRPGVRVNCSVCGEEIINQRELEQDGKPICRHCALGGYYQSGSTAALSMEFALDINAEDVYHLWGRGNK